MRPISHMFIAFMLIAVTSFTHSTAQDVFTIGAYIDTTSPIDFVMGEYVTEYTQPAAIGFLPTMMFTAISSERQLCDTLSIQAIFDNEQLRATLYTTQKMVDLTPHYYISSANGIVYLNGSIENDTQFIDYSRLPNGVYILQVIVPGRIPYVTRWLKK